MVLQVLSDGWVVDLDIDPSCLEHLGVTNARQFEQLRRLYATSADNNLPWNTNRIFIAFIGESSPYYRPLALPGLEKQLLDRRSCEEDQVRPLCTWPIVGRCGVAPLTSLRFDACEGRPCAYIRAGKMAAVDIHPNFLERFVPVMV